MNLILERMKRAFSFAVALLLLILNTGIVSVASAANDAVSTDLYALIAAEYFSEDAAASAILTSGVLRGNSPVSIRSPGSNDALLSLEGTTLTAKSFASEYNDLKWTAYRYTSGAEQEAIHGSTVSVSQEGLFRAQVDYQLILTHVDRNVLLLPANLMAEADNQLYVLDKLTNENDPYMGYMSKMNKTTVSMLAIAVSPSDPVNIGMIHDDAKKNTALKECFSSVISDMQKTCYASGSKTLKIYDLLTQYKAEKDEGAGLGLAYYYENSEAFLTELGLFSGYLTEMMREDPDNNLTKEDKIIGLERLAAAAEKKGVKIGEYAELIPQLEQKMATVNRMLTAPNAKIDVGHDALVTLTKILESGATVTKYDEQPTLHATVIADLCCHIYDDDGDTDCNACGTVRLIPEEDDSGSGGDSGSGSGGNNQGGSSDSSSGGNSGSSGGSGDGNNSGSGSTGGSADSGSNEGNGSGGDNNESSSGSESGSFSGPIIHSVSTISNFATRVARADDGDIVRLSRSMTMTDHVSVNGVITIDNANKLNQAGHTLVLNNAIAAVTADSALNVGSAVDGYMPVMEQNNGKYIYRLTEMNAPKIGGEVAGSKFSTHNNARYLYLDLDPANGMTLNQLHAGTYFSQLSGYSVTFSVEGNDGSGLIKTADRLLVTACDNSGNTIAKVTYVVIVMGDINCNGKVNSSDAAAAKNIGMGETCDLEARLAADVNFSGTPDAPKINTSDVSYIMAKWFAWDLNKYDSNLK